MPPRRAVNNNNKRQANETVSTKRSKKARKKRGTVDQNAAEAIAARTVKQGKSPLRGNRKSSSRSSTKRGRLGEQPRRQAVGGTAPAGAPANSSTNDAQEARRRRAGARKMSKDELQKAVAGAS